ncbi:MAG: hypothetical protein QOE31_2064 [Solirubrobacteraceae bacterium]|jgi:hypothetical protein|nr:hypothetical protein [Solirubrobacteraceae bacterium]
MLTPAMAAYSFLTTWCVAAPLERVWEVLSDAERYPEWWKGVRKVTVLEPGGDGGRGVGTLYRMQWRSKLPYSLEFDSRVTRLEPPHLLMGQASGELEGVGVWRLYEGAAGTAAIYSWDVSTTRAWMNAVGPLARPVFAWNHDYVMRQGAHGLAERLGAKLVAQN